MATRGAMRARIKTRVGPPASGLLASGRTGGPAPRGASPRAAGEQVEPHVVDRQRVGQPRERRLDEAVPQLLGQPLEERAEADRAQVAGPVPGVDVDAGEPAPD